MSIQYGVWSEESGGFVCSGAWSPEEAGRDRQAEIDQADADDRAEAAEDLSVRRICSEHDEQPADGCEDCATDDDEDDEDQDDDEDEDEGDEDW